MDATVSIVRMSRVFATIVFSLLWSFEAHAVPINAHPNLQRVVDELVAEKVYTKSELVELIAKATVQEDILNAMKNPAESKFTWGRYRKIFMQPERFESGAEFWQEYAQELNRAEQEYGVPAEMIVAIIGVESKFGRFKGTHKVIDALVSLVVDFPRRSAFFADELKHFLILAKENNLALDEVLGSYAGAMGYPQFISSSYRHYAVDFSGDGVIDLINQPADAIGSIANYFVKNGWQRGAPVTSSSHATLPENVTALANRQRSVKFSAEELRALGAPIAAHINADEQLNVLWLNAAEEVNDPQKSGLYLVRAGDTICEIAEAHKVPCKALMLLNNIGPRGAIYRGQQLKMPQVSEQAAAAKNGAVAAKPSDSKWTVNARTDDAPAFATIDQYYFTHENFYVITRYNQSVLYAMAVYELANAIRLQYEQTHSAQEAY